jgi:hypothetical protein
LPRPELDLTLYWSLAGLLYTTLGREFPTPAHR